jgi:hypothetical protein
VLDTANEASGRLSRPPWGGTSDYIGPDSVDSPHVRQSKDAPIAAVSGHGKKANALS